MQTARVSSRPEWPAFSSAPQFGAPATERAVCVLCASPDGGTMATIQLNRHRSKARDLFASLLLYFVTSFFKNKKRPDLSERFSNFDFLFSSSYTF
jgi:hypothetical protein